MAKNIYSLQLLRNGTPYTSYTEAVAGIKTAATTDGTIKLARYYQTGASGNTKADKYNTNGEIKTIFGIYNVLLGEKAAGYTIFDATHEVLENIQAQIDSITGEGGSVAKQIKAAIDRLNYTGVTTGDGVVVTNVTESSGVVSATSAEVGGLKLTNYALGSNSSAVAANDTINEALSKLQNQVNKANEDAEEAIKALDANITAENGSYIDHIEQVDGKISGTTKILPSLAEVHEDGKPIIAVSEDKGQLAASAGTINAQYVNVTGDTFTANNVQAALEEIETEYKAADAAIVGDASESGNTLGKLEDRIEGLATNAKEYHIVKTTDDLPETIKERYSLVDAAGNVSGATVDIPKDSHIVSITYNGTTQKLTYNYIDASGNTQSTDVDMSELVLETEFGSGVTVTNHVAHGVVDTASEKDADNNPFLTVGENGFKVDGIKHAIDAAVSGASEDLQDAIDDLSGKTVALSGKAVTSIASADGSVTATPRQAADGTVVYDLSTDASKVRVSSVYAAGTNAPIATGDTLDVALAKLEKQVAAANASVQKDANATHLTVTTGTGTNDETIYTIGESDIASASALTAEIAARKAVDGVNGDAYTADTNAHYINNANTLYGADQALDASLYTVSGKVDNAQAEIDRMESAIGLKEDGTYSANTTNNYTSAVTSVNGAIDALDDAVKANEDAIKTLSGSSLSGVSVNGHALTISNNVATQTVNGKQTDAIATGNEAIVVETDEHGNLVLGISILDAGTY